MQTGEAAEAEKETKLCAVDVIGLVVESDDNRDGLCHQQAPASEYAGLSFLAASGLALLPAGPYMADFRAVSLACPAGTRMEALYQKDTADAHEGRRGSLQPHTARPSSHLPQVPDEITRFSVPLLEQSLHSNPWMRIASVAVSCVKHRGVWCQECPRGKERRS